MLTRPRLRSGNSSMIKTTGSFLGTVIMRPTGRTVLGANSSISSTVSRICCVTQSPGPQKNEFGSAQGFSYGFFIPHTFDQINTAQVLGYRSEGAATGLGSFRFARRRKTAIFSNCPVSAEVFRAVIIKKNCPKDTSPKDTSPKDTSPKDTSPKDTSPKDTRPSDCCCRCSYGS